MCLFNKNVLWLVGSNGPARSVEVQKCLSVTIFTLHLSIVTQEILNSKCQLEKILLHTLRQLW